jgi:hypothetical protein
MEQSEEEGGWEKADGALDRATEKELLGEAGEEGEEDRLRNRNDAEDAGESELQFAGQGEPPGRETPDPDEEEPRAHPRGEVEPEVPAVDEERRRNLPAREADPEAGGDR